MIDFAPGMRTIIRDEEWMVKKIETNSLGKKTLYCIGVSPLVKDREAIFLTDLEKIQIVDPAEVKLVADVSPFYKRALLYLESQWRQQIPTDANLHIGHKAARAGIRSYAIKRNKVDDRSFDGLRVATMHRVKGLEFKYVFIAAVNNRIIPLPSAINKTDAVSEAESITSEKCLLYVAMTRAQKGVYITSYGRPSEFLG